MATVRLFQRFETTVGGVTYTGGSLTTPTSIAAASTSTEEVFDTVMLATSDSQKIFDNAREMGGSANFDFMWIENQGGTNPVRVQMTVDAGTGDEHLVYLLAAGHSMTLGSDDAVSGTTVDNFSGTGGTANTIDEIWVGCTTGLTTPVRVFAIT